MRSKQGQAVDSNWVRLSKDRGRGRLPTDLLAQHNHLHNYTSEVEIGSHEDLFCPVDLVS